MKKIVITSLLPLVFLFSFCQKKTTPAPDPTEKDSVSKKTYEEIIRSATFIRKGLFTVIISNEHYYFDIPRNLLNKDLLAVVRLSRGSAEGNMGVLAATPGDDLNNFTFHFRRRMKRLFIEKDYYSVYTGDSTSGLNQSISRAEVPPIIGSLPVEADNPDSSSFLVDFTEYILSSNEFFSFPEFRKSQYFLGDFIKESSYVSEVRAYPTNVEIASVKTFNSTQPARVPATCELNTSIIELPEQVMKPRFQDIRVGYFWVEQQSFSESADGVRSRNYIKRWLVEPKDEDRERYLRGELVEPKKPIIFYIDPATPEKYIPWLIAGVNAWQKAFEKAGFKNAIYARKAPTREEDSTWSLYDARNSCIIYKASSIENAMGPSIADPRSGQILESHISWYHNILQLLHDWYFVQCSAVDTAARKMQFNDTLMGRLIQYACTHEVGHALGLLHNMVASSSVPVDSLRSEAYLEKNGLCPSVMDYARFNYVLQPGDGANLSSLIGRLGVYDMWAIEWGYHWFPQTSTAAAEQLTLSALATKRLKDPRLQFLFENSSDPRSQRDDLGDDPSLAGSYGISNLKRILPNLIDWTRTHSESYQSLNHMYGEVVRQFARYLGQAANYINRGYMENLKASMEGGDMYGPISKEKQEHALQFLKQQFLARTPYWLFDSAILNRIGETGLNMMQDISDALMGSLLLAPHNGMLYARNEVAFRGKTYSLKQVLDSLTESVWRELKTHEAVDPYRRVLQISYLDKLIRNFQDEMEIGLITHYPVTQYSNNYQAQVSALLLAQVRKLQEELKTNLGIVKDPETKAHYQYLLYQIDRRFSTRR